MYDPVSFNPLRSISATLAHADPLHLATNLLFFFAWDIIAILRAGLDVSRISMVEHVETVLTGFVVGYVWLQYRQKVLLIR